MPVYKHTDYERVKEAYRRDQAFIWTARLAALIFLCLTALWLYCGLMF